MKRTFIVTLLLTTLAIAACYAPQSTSAPPPAPTEMQPDAAFELPPIPTPRPVGVVPDPAVVDSYAGLPIYTRLEHCFFPNDAAECGYVTVPADRGAAGGKTINLGVMRFPATGAAPAPDPLVLAEGGPGASIMLLASFSYMEPWFAEINMTRDLVFFDQRGTQYSRPFLECPGYSEARERAAEVNQFQESGADVAAALRACADAVEADGWDLSDFNSLEDAADVDAIRQALGYDQINYYGVSYGSMLGQHLMRLYPETLRSVILDGVLPLSENWGAGQAIVKDGVFNTLSDACAQDATCSGRFPDLAQSFNDLYLALEATPYRLDRPRLQGNDIITQTIYLDGDLMANIAFDQLYNPSNTPRLLDGLAATQQGDYTYWTNYLDASLAYSSVAYLMHFAFVCAEDADFTLDEVRLDQVGPMMAGYSRLDTGEYLAVCPQLNIPSLNGPLDEPVSSDLPTLLLSGQFDPITNPVLLDKVLPGLSNAFSYVVPGGGHGQFFDDACAADIVRQFLIDPTAAPDAGCLAGLSVDFAHNDNE